jgi:hypothetical protein
MSKNLKAKKAIKEYSEARLRKTVEILIKDILKDKLWGIMLSLARLIVPAIITGLISFAFSKFLK